MLPYIVIKITKTKAFKLFIFLGAISFLVLFIGTKKNILESNACGVASLTEEVIGNNQTAIFEGKELSIPKIALKKENTQVLGQTDAEKWVEVDLSEQKLRAWEGDSLFLETLVSTGLPWFPTPKGEFRIWSKARATKMEGGSGKYYYNLPNVPYVMFFENSEIPGFRGFSLHGTYWHNDFGNVHSHGCVNLPTSVAEKLFFWTTPISSGGKGFIRSSEENQGTRIVIHE